MNRLLLALTLLLLAAPAGGVLLDSGNGNTSAPATDDPGWNNVSRTGVYAGYGWLLTASHTVIVPGQIVPFPDGTSFPLIPESRVVFQRTGESTTADLAAVRLYPAPRHLPVLEIPTSSPPLDTEVRMIGTGFSQGAPSSWSYWDAQHSILWSGGWNWAPIGGQRWGTNHVGGWILGEPSRVDTYSFANAGQVTQSLVVEFNPGGPGDEAIATVGDSGQGLFVKNTSTQEWELAGIMWARTVHPNQPDATSIYGNDALSVDLFYYRPEILAVIRPCDDGVDNDGDFAVDMGDPDCLWEGDMSELPACSDGLDNDWDGLTDLADTADCTSASDLLEETDQDGDLVPDGEDNCVALANADQRDTNLDGYGNLCDLDINDDGVIGGPDFRIVLGLFGAEEGEPAYDPDVDMDGDGAIGASEFSAVLNQFGGVSGPSGLACAGTIPCQ
jgi:hypothetical protein